MADTEREAFEAKYRGALDLTPCAENDGYMAYSTYCAWRAWKDRGAGLASRPAEVDDEGLPPLPDAWHGFRFNSGWNTWEQVSHWAKGDDDVARAYTAEQFRQGQRDAVAADRARREKGGA